MIFLSGRFMPLEDATISVLDRGFIFGDGVYEMIPVYSRHPFRLREHLARLQNSLDAIRLVNPYSLDEWARIINQIIAGNTGEDQSIYLQITRGPAKRDHAFPPRITPTIFVMSAPLTLPPAVTRERGVVAVTARDNRWLRCDIKSVSLLPNVLLRQAAVDAGAAETVLLRDGLLTEGAASNIFVIRHGVLLAPPKSHLMLPGITYDVVLELAAAAGIPSDIRQISEAEVRDADELWLTSSTKEILPITTLDEQPVGDGRPGPLYQRIAQCYQEYKTEVMRSGIVQ